MSRSNCRILMFGLLTIMVGCRPTKPIPPATVMGTLIVPTVEPGRIFFVRSESIQSGYEDHSDNLWTMYPDGSGLRQLTFDEPPGIGYHTPRGGVPALVFVSATSVDLDTDRIQQIPMPEVCQAPPFPQYDNNRVFDFRFSLSGRYVSFSVGNDGCGGAVLRVLDSQTGMCSEIEDYDRLVKWLPDDRALVAMASCEYGALSLYDPSTAQTSLLGYGSVGEWNRDQTAFFATVPDRLIGWSNVLWVYNVQVDTFIHQPPQPADTATPGSGQTETAIGWTSDGSHLLYTHRSLSYTYNLTNSLPSTTTFGPNQLYIVDTLGQREQVLIDDPTHDYFVCGRDGEQFIVQRTPYQAFSVSTDAVDWNMLSCPLFGKGCANAEHFLLDWHTRKLTPLPMSPRPTATQVSVVAAPDLNSEPIYSTPDGGFALYPGSNGIGLWRVSAAGEKILLVADGHHFVYVGE